MISNIIIEGYKCLRNADIATGSLNILVGPNASGKSSFIQALLLLRQSADINGEVKDLQLSGPLFEAGTVQDVMHPAADHKVRLKLKYKSSSVNFLFRNVRDEISSPKRYLENAQRKKIPLPLRNYGNGFAYLNAERVGPRLSYSLPPGETDISGLVGKHGEYTAAILARAKSNNIFIKKWDSALALKFSYAVALLDSKDIKASLLNSQGRLDLVVNEMLGWILPGAVFDASEFDQSDTATIRFIRDPLTTKSSVRATHVGFGLIYTLPIITACLSLNPGGLLIIENPEAHLHPYSQSRIGVFLALIASTGRQIFIETHSDHVVNGIRLAAKNNLLPAKDIYINYFNRPAGEDGSQITPIRTSAAGRLNPWPKGFFDQIENDLSQL